MTVLRVILWKAVEEHELGQWDRKGFSNKAALVLGGGRELE